MPHVVENSVSYVGYAVFFNREYTDYSLIRPVRMRRTSYQRAWPMPSEVSMVLCSKTKPRKIIPASNHRVEILPQGRLMSSLIKRAGIQGKKAPRSWWLRIPIVIQQQTCSGEERLPCCTGWKPSVLHRRWTLSRGRPSPMLLPQSAPLNPVRLLWSSCCTVEQWR